MDTCAKRKMDTYFRIFGIRYKKRFDLGVKTTLQKIAMHTKINNFLKI